MITSPGAPQSLLPIAPTRNGLARQLLVVTVLVLTTIAAFVSAIPNAHAGGGPPAGGEIVIIHNVHVGSPITTSECNQSDNDPVIPVRIIASFIPPPGVSPNGPYATAVWDGGYGSSDMHAGSSQAHDATQVFHILMRPGPNGVLPGHYTVSVLVQDVGLAGGLAAKSKDFTINVPTPFRGKTGVKCPLAEPAGSAGGFAAGLAAAIASSLKSKACGLCSQLKGYYDSAVAYSSILDLDLKALAEKDPPDPDYQELAGSDPPPVLPVSTDFSASQQSALITLETDLANAIGLVRAALTTTNRIWGAGNAGDLKWFAKQRLHLADLAEQEATALNALPAAYAAAKSAIDGILPSFAVTRTDVSGLLSTLWHGLPTELNASFTALGTSAEDRSDLAQLFQTADASTLAQTDGRGALLGAPTDFAKIAAGLGPLITWARNSVNEPRPVITSIDSDTAPTTGGTTLTIDGLHLAEVTGFSFGPSTETSGLGTIQSCTDTECDVTVPPGTGTVDIAADGPSGPSASSSADRLTYVTPDQPVVSRIYPTSGSTAGVTQVTVFGSGLQHGAVYFGPTISDSWTCAPTHCTALAPESKAALPVDVTVISPDDTTSALSAADRFTYSDSPVTPPAPTVTGVSPAAGSDLGGEQVSITGTGFNSASGVNFGDVPVDDYTVQSDTTIRAISPGGNPGQSPVHVTVNGAGGQSAMSADDHFSLAAYTPVITSISPSSGLSTGSTPVTITGTHLFAGTVTFTDSDQVESFARSASCTPTTCTVSTPPGTPGAAAVKVETADGESGTKPFTYTHGAGPTITSVSPSSALITGPDPVTGDTIVDRTAVLVLGTNLDGGSVSIGGHAAQVAGSAVDPCGPTACLVYAPTESSAGQQNLVVKTPTGASTPFTFSYVTPATPTITDIEPKSGWLDGFGTVDVYGTNLTAAEIYFGDQKSGSAALSQCTRSSCTVSPPSAADVGPVDVRAHNVTGVSATSSAATYDYVLPTITSVSPKSGFVTGGTPVTVTGSHLADAEISFDYDVADDWHCTDTQCTGPSPAVSDPGTVDIQADSPDQQAVSATGTADQFTYLAAPKPVISAVTPNSATEWGGDIVTVTGTGFTNGTVLFGTSSVNSACTDTQCTVTSPSGDVGPTQVTVQTTGGTSLPKPFTFTAPAQPTISSVAPASGTAGGGTAFTVTGTNLSNSELSFAGNDATGVTCSAQQCTGRTPKGVAGAVDVIAHNQGGTSSVSSADTYTYLASPVPTVTAVSPTTGPASGGTRVVVTGTDLDGATIAFGNSVVAAQDTTCTATSCVAYLPPATPGSVSVSATTPSGQSAASGASAFVVSSVSIDSKAIPGVADPTGAGRLFTAADGATWFTMTNPSLVGHIATNGTITTYPTLDSDADPLGISQSADGRIWYAETAPNKLVSMTTTGTGATGYQLPGVGTDLRDIAPGPDGRIWFALAHLNNYTASASIGAITTSGPDTGKVWTTPLDDPTALPSNIIAGPDGRMWFSERAADKIGAITTSGKITEYDVKSAGAAPSGITVGPDGRLWFTELSSTLIAAMTTDGAETDYVLPDYDTPGGAITSGGDGRLWYTTGSIEQVSAIDPITGAVSDYSLPGSSTRLSPRYLAMSPDGSLWATEYDGSGILRISGVTAGVTPTVTDVSPAHGSSGTQVTIRGANLAGATAVHFGSTAGTIVSGDAAQLIATAPAGAGTVDITVTTPHGTTAASTADSFRYGAAPAVPTVTAVSPAFGPTSGGTTVTVTGTNLAGATIAFGAAAATAVTCTATSCSATSPAGAVGTVHIVATTQAWGASSTADSDRFTYQPIASNGPAPTVSAVSPSSGPAAGGTTVTVTGTNLTGASISFGTDAGPTATCSDTSCTVVSPSGTGTVDVIASTDSGTSAVTAADHFTYETTASSTVPGAPGQPTAAAGAGAATVRWAAPASTGGLPITSYHVTPYKNGVAQPAINAGTALTRTVTGLTNGASYRFSVHATNANGDGAESVSSATVVPRVPTALTITSAPASATYGAPITIKGKLTQSGRSTAIGGVAVSVQYRKAGSAGSYVTYGSAVHTSSAGAVTLTIRPPYSVQLRLTVASAGAYAGSNSSTRTLSIRRKIASKLSHAKIKKGATTTLSGTITPAAKGTTIYLQRKSGSTWVTVTHRQLTSAAYHFTVKGTAKSTKAYRVLVNADSSFAQSIGAVETVRVT